MTGKTVMSHEVLLHFFPGVPFKVAGTIFRACVSALKVALVVDASYVSDQMIT